jgi:ubiquinone/menaquinone biosynthesis C-methylase UbiE
MTRIENATRLDAEQTNGDWSPKITLTPKKQPLIATWLSEFEEKIARDFQRRTGLDYKTTLQQIIEAADPFPGMQILDVPTGTGIIARQFVGKIGEKGRIIGADETREKIEEARLAAQSAKVSLRIEWRMMPCEKLIFEDSCFDLITSVTAFHRMPAQQKFLAEAHRVLKPGGRLLIADELAPDSGASQLKLSIRRQYYRFIARDQVEAGANFLTTQEIVRMLGEAGFSQTVVRGLRQAGENDQIFTLIKAVK